MKKIFLKFFIFLFIFLFFFQRKYAKAAIKWEKCDNSSQNCADFCKSRGKICVDRCIRIYDPQDKSHLFDKTSSYPKEWNNVGLFHEESIYYGGWRPYGGGAGYCRDTKSPLPAPPYFNSNLSIYCNWAFNVSCCCADTCEDLITFGDADCDGDIDDTDYIFWRCDFLADVCPTLPHKSDFNSDSKVDLIDFEIWRQNRFAPTQTNAPTNTPALPASPTQTRAPTPTPTPTPNLTSNLTLAQMKSYIIEQFKKNENLSDQTTISFINEGTQETWGNSCLGCVSPGTVCGQVITEGIRFVLKAQKSGGRCIYADYRVANSYINGALSCSYYNKNTVRQCQRVEDVCNYQCLRETNLQCPYGMTIDIYGCSNICYNPGSCSIE